MELRQLRYLVAVAEEGTFTRAATRVRVAQPAISQQIAQLERELGERLFDRSDRRVRLTPAGEAFLPFARAALDAAVGGRDAVNSLRGVLAGRLTLGTVPFPPAAVLDQLQEFQRRHARVRLTLRVGDPEDLAADVASGLLDAAVIGVASSRLPAGPTGQRLPAALASTALATEPLVIAVPPGHPLAANATADLADLRDEPIVTLTRGTGLRSTLEAACDDLGFTVDVHAETDDLTLVADLVGRGLGVALLPRSVAERAQSRLVAVELRRPALNRPMVLIWPRQRVSIPGRAFLDLFRARDEPAAT